MDIGDKHFKTKKELEEYVRNIIMNIGICKSVKTVSISDYNFFINLFRRHPKYPEKIYNICDISIITNKVNAKLLELNIIRHDGSVDDISWRNCVSGAEKDNFKCALRVSIEEQLKSFRRTANNECDICKTLEADEYHVDHVNHFEEILYGFLQTTKRVKPIIFQNTKDNRKSFISDDKEYEEEWKSYHKNMACLRILCRSCNLKRPKWKNASV
jgi:hypothetical protein